MQKPYPVITLCGSTRFKKEFLEVQKQLTLKGNVVISVGLFEHSGDSEVWENMDEGTVTKTKEMIDDMHKQKIDMADEIFVINVGGYIGDSTRSEIEYAKAHGKRVNYLEPTNAFEKMSENAIELNEEPAKAYLVSSGSYSDYQINEVFLDKAAAEKYCAVHNVEHSRFSDPYRIEEYDINDGSSVDTSEQVLWYYSAFVGVVTYGSRKGELETGGYFDFTTYQSYDLVISGDNRRPNTWKITEDRRGDTLIGYTIDIYLDHEDGKLATKIAQDRWNEFKATLEGVKL